MRGKGVMTYRKVNMTALKQRCSNAIDTSLFWNTGVPNDEVVHAVAPHSHDSPDFARNLRCQDIEMWRFHHVFQAP